ncbi:GPI ethanolamine phosphate transferase 2 [Schistosoma japonicum]|uniref:GPI ethanolamine phosphate transferase 2 n=1 Tax=Schistosoma japonicum TaxID=6182 RepID=A0A4Z2CLZ5_SCHJA|nr:GPI ethanolamine phosphate transferase 2 [Schistosoma japonicum]
MNGLLPGDSVTNVGKIVQSESTYKIDKLVVIVIDALRVDFLFSSKFSKYWVKLRSYMNLKSATCSASVVQPPTVTLPRIKAIVSGRTPKFIDVLRNVDVVAMLDDNWVTRLVNLQWKLQFYGDDTWIKLFPKSFQAYEGTNSFYVNDFYEVDRNVTRHIATLMNSSDKWDGLILHYLGLDHIGHIEGPSGSSIPEKIREMDEAIHSILETLINSSSFVSKNWLFILTGDHGISDKGSHGGSTSGEKTTGLFMLGSNLNKTNDHSTKTCSAGLDLPKSQQVDLATLIGLITGSGIPSKSLGVLSSTWLNNIWSTNQDRLKVLYTLMQHIGHLSGECIFASKKYHKLEFENCDSNVWDKEQTTKYNVLLNEIITWLHCQKVQANFTSDFKEIDCKQSGSHLKGEILIANSTKLLQKIQSGSLAKSEHLNNTQMIFGGILMWTVTLLLFHKIFDFVIFSPDAKIAFSNKKNQKTLIQYYYSDTADLSYSFDPSLVQIICWFGTICLILHSFSLASSSWAEEEHQLWYYFSSSLILLTSLLIVLGNVKSTVKWIILKIIIKILLLDRFLLRRLHQTGNKWIHLPDISDWLYKPEHISVLWICLLTGWISFLIFRCKAIFHLRPKCSSLRERCTYYAPLISGIFIVFNQLAYRVAIADYEYEDAIHSARIVYLLCIVDAFCLYKSRVIRLTKNTNHLFGQTSSDASKAFWDTIIHPLSTLNILMCLLGKPVITILWLSIWIKEALLSEMIQLIFHYSGMHSSHNTFHYILPLCSWLIYWTQGWVSFFQQGNSLSLSTIDLSAAYVGLRYHQPIIAGLLLAFYTYSGPLIWQLAYFCRFVLPGRKHFGGKFNCLVLGFIVLPITLCGTYCFCLQSHLFIWTVFTPKMLYSAVFYLTMIPLLCFWSVIFP